MSLCWKEMDLVEFSEMMEVFYIFTSWFGVWLMGIYIYQILIKIHSKYLSNCNLKRCAFLLYINYNSIDLKNKFKKKESLLWLIALSQSTPPFNYYSPSSNASGHFCTLFSLFDALRAILHIPGSSHSLNFRLIFTTSEHSPIIQTKAEL